MIRVEHDFEADVLSAARNLSDRYKSYTPHIDALTQMATLIFDTMKKVHGLGRRERLLLQGAAILHDCGKYINMSRSSECSYNIIMATEMIGLSLLERELVANVVRFNSEEILSYEELAASSLLGNEENMKIAKLTAILRVANALDRSHRQKIREIKVTLKDITKANKEGILKLGAKGVVEIDDQLKIILGSDAKKLKKYMQKFNQEGEKKHVSRIF